MRNYVVHENVHDLAASYDSLADISRKAELNVVTRLMRSGQHANRQHRERTRDCAQELFEQTSPDNLALRHVKLKVFGVPDGKPIMDLRTHPFIKNLYTVYDGDAAGELVLFETAEGHASVLDQCALPPQREFVAFLGKFYFFPCIVATNDMFSPGAGNLFHFKLDQGQYSIKPEDYGKKPLIFDKKDLAATTYLNEFFFYVFDKFTRWQGMRSQSITSLDSADALVRSSWAPHPASGLGNWRPALPEIPCVSKMMVAYLASFLGVSPFRETQDPRVDTKIDLLYKDSLTILNESSDANYVKYIERKMHRWYIQFPPCNAAVADNTDALPSSPRDNSNAAADEAHTGPSRGMVLSEDEA